MPAGKTLMEAAPGTYALCLYNQCSRPIQVGRWKTVIFEAGYYIYIGSAFGPGGIRSRVGRHLRKAKSKRWHIDYLRHEAAVSALWVNYGNDHLEHDWAKALLQSNRVSSVPGFGCSDCDCLSHLFYSAVEPNDKWLRSMLVGEVTSLDIGTCGMNNDE